MRCFPIAALCLLLFAFVARADTPGSLPVTVRDRNGTPLVGVRLTLQPSARAVMTDRRGQATFTGVPPGSYIVSLAPLGYQPLSLPVTLTADAESSMGFVLEKNGPASVATRSAAGTDYRVIVPGVPHPVNPPPEYLLTPPVPPGSGPAWRAAQEVTLREGMFRYLIDNARVLLSQDKTKRFLTCYLSVGEGKDPDPALLKCLQNPRLPVRPISALRPRSRNWISFQVSAIHWTDGNNVKIEAGSSQFNVLSSVFLTYTLTLRNGWWEITGSMGISA